MLLLIAAAITTLLSELRYEMAALVVAIGVIPADCLIDVCSPRQVTLFTIGLYRVEQRVRHDRRVVSEHPNLHFLRLVGLDRRYDGAYFSPVHGVPGQREAKLVGQVTSHRAEVVLYDERFLPKSQLAPLDIVTLAALRIASLTVIGHDAFLSFNNERLRVVVRHCYAGDFIEPQVVRQVENEGAVATLYLLLILIALFIASIGTIIILCLQLGDPSVRCEASNDTGASTYFHLK